ncbi:hypothetical protein UlMin_008078 [Ulmus minor]
MPFSSKPSKPTSLVDTNLQAKAMSASAIFDSSKYSLSKPNLEKRSKGAKDDACIEKPIKELEKKKKKFHELLVKQKKEPDVFDKHRNSVSLPLSGGRRRSFGGPKVELADVFANNGVKVVSVDMPPFMQIHAVEFARKTHDSLEKFTSKTLALTLKKEFDGVYGPAWHCIVGTSFGSFVTHSVGGFLYFSMDQKLYVLLFKTTVQKAD